MNTELRKNCPMRHENGNCTPCGGFCTAVNDQICEGLHNAYDTGVYVGALRAQKDINEMGGIAHLKELVQAENDGRLVVLPLVAMVEQSLQGGQMKPQCDQRFNGRYAVVYLDKKKWACPLIDICGTPYNSREAEERRKELAPKETRFGERLVVLPEVPELPFHRGDRIYIIDNCVKGSIRVTRLESYLVYPENPVRVLVKCTANSSWHELKNVYATREGAETALAEKGKDNA